VRVLRPLSSQQSNLTTQKLNARLKKEICKLSIKILSLLQVLMKVKNKNIDIRLREKEKEVGKDKDQVRHQAATKTIITIREIIKKGTGVIMNLQKDNNQSIRIGGVVAVDINVIGEY